MKTVKKNLKLASEIVLSVAEYYPTLLLLLKKLFVVFFFRLQVNGRLIAEVLDESKDRQCETENKQIFRIKVRSKGNFLLVRRKVFVKSAVPLKGKC